MRRDGDLQATSEALMADGRWLRISRSPTRDDGFIILCSDISRLKKQEWILRETNLLLDAALENMTQGLCLYDPQNRLEVFNRRYLEIFRLPRDQIKPGISFREVLEVSIASGNHPNKTVDELLAERMQLISGNGVGPHLYEFADGRVVSCLYSPTADGGWVATYEDITERRQAEAKIMHMARHDALTNLPNRMLFRDKMEQSLSRGDKLAVMFLDLDRFKSVNDTLGHPVGDALLCAVTERLQRVVRSADTVARLGGDEFAIVQAMRGPTDASELAAADHRDAARAVRSPRPSDRHRHQHRYRHGAGRRQRPRPAAAQRRHGALPRQGGRPRHLSLLPAGNGRADAGAAPARARSAQGAAGRAIRALLPADRRYRDRQRRRLRGACCAGTIPSAAWSCPTTSSRSPKRSA